MTSPSTSPSFWKSPGGLALIVVLAVVGFFLVTEHQAHLFGALPYLVLLACPLMHRFMHKGHGHGAGHKHRHRHEEPHDEPRR